MNNKSNLIDIFKTNTEKEINGSWYSPYKGIEFLVARFGGANKIRRQEMIGKYYLPFVDKIKNNELTEDERKRIDIQSFVHSCILDWKGVTINGEESEYNAEDLTDMLMELTELADTLIAFASNRDSYKDDLGNC